MTVFLHYLIILSIFFDKIKTQNFLSPCPRLFSYETRTFEKDRYFGNVRIETSEELSGVWLRIVFDRPCVQLGNWLGEVSTEDNKEFLIKKRSLKLKAGDFLTVRFYVKYTPGKEIPQLEFIRLNGRQICPEIRQTTQTPPSKTTFSIYDILLEERNGNSSGTTNTSSLIPITTTSLPFSTTVSSTVTVTTPRTPPSPYNLIHEFELPGPSSTTPTSELETEDYGEFFQGDLSIVNSRPRHEECGIVRPPPNRHAEIHEGSFPWHAAIYLSKGTELTYICAASLISTKFVLTVAHCVTKRNSETPVRPEHLLIYLGKYYLRRWSNPAIQERQVKDIYIHEQYDHATTQNDIAMLILTKPVKINDYVRPVCLWKEKLAPNINGETGMVVGWGFNEHGIVTSKLVKTYMKIVSKNTCLAVYPEFFTHFNGGQSFCAAFSNGTSVCNGDSGGGMVFGHRFPGVFKPIYHLKGLVSISVALQNEFRCDSEHHVIFTDVSNYREWIEKFRIH